jgi:hypothetical protein
MHWSSKSAQSFLLGAAARNEQKKTESLGLLYVDPLWAGPLHRLMMSFVSWGVSPNVMNCVEFGFDRWFVNCPNFLLMKVTVFKPSLNCMWPLDNFPSLFVSRVHMSEAESRFRQPLLGLSFHVGSKFWSFLAHIMKVDCLHILSTATDDRSLYLLESYESSLCHSLFKGWGN